MPEHEVRLSLTAEKEGVEGLDEEDAEYIMIQLKAARELKGE